VTTDIRQIDNLIYSLDYFIPVLKAVSL